MKETILKRWKLAFLILGMTFVLSGCHDYYGETEDVIDRTFNVAEGGTLTMDVRPGAIEVQAQNSDKITVKVIRKARTDDKEEAEEIFAHYPIDFKQSGNDVTIVSTREHERGLFSLFRRNRYHARYIVTVPKKYNLDLRTSGGSIVVGDIEGRVYAKTSGGSLQFAKIKGPVQGNTSGGSIRLEGCMGNAELDTSGGSISVGSVGGELKAETSGGAIRIEEAMGIVQAHTSGGSVTATILKQPGGDCSLKTLGGSVNIYLPEDIKADINASTSGGSVHTDFAVMVEGELSRHRLKTKINGGGPLIYLHTSGGSIGIHKIEKKLEQ